METFIIYNYKVGEEEEIYGIDNNLDVYDVKYIRNRIKEMGIDSDKIGQLPKVERNAIISKLRQDFSIRQIERATGISRGIISRCK